MKLDLQRTDPTPIYQQLKQQLRQEIISGRWPAHYKLKAEVDLAQELGVSRGTVRRAIEELIAEGLLIRIHGRGTFVTSPVLEQPLAESLVAFSEALLSRGIDFETRLLAQDVIVPDERVRSLLDLAPGRPVLALRRVRLVGGQPVVLLHNYVATTHCPGLEQVDFGRARLFQTLEQQYGLKLDWGRRFFEAQIAIDDTAAQLGVPPGSAVMYMEQVVFLDTGEPIELSDVWLRGDRFRLSADVKRSRTAKPLPGALELY